MKRSKPQKQLVSKRQYVGIVGERLSLYVFGGLQLACGLAGVSLLSWLLWQASHSGALSDTSREAVIVFSLAIGVTSLLLVVSSRSLLKKANKIDPVTLITTRTAHLLPSEEVLVRASDLPPAQQQSELLRATHMSPETPAEELLRSSNENKSV